MGIELFCAPYIYVLTILMVILLSEYTLGQRTPEFEESPFYSSAWYHVWQLFTILVIVTSIVVSCIKTSWWFLLWFILILYIFVPFVSTHLIRILKKYLDYNFARLFLWFFTIIVDIAMIVVLLI